MSRNTSFGGFICAVLAVIVGCGAFFELRQHFSKDDSSESEMSIESVMDSSESIESEESGGDNEQETVITDLNFYSNPDNFTEVEVVEGEKLAGNVYRFLKTPLDMDGDVSNGPECYVINGLACPFVSSSEEGVSFGFSDLEYGESYPLEIWKANKPVGDATLRYDYIIEIQDLGISYNWVTLDGECYVDIYFAPGSTFTITNEYGSELYMLNVDELTWFDDVGIGFSCVKRLVAKTS